MLICTRMASEAFGSIGTHDTTFGILQIKRTTVHRSLTQRSIQLDSASAVISAVKTGRARHR